MSVPFTISKDDLRDQENFNYSAIDQYWQDKGYTEEFLRSQYSLALFFASLNFCVAIGLYFSTWLSRKKISLAKLLGEEKMNGWEKFCTEFKLGQTPAINFVSSCLVTNDRVFITLRVVLAIWSMVITLFTWAGTRSIFFGSYYPVATLITIHVSRHRHLIVEGFGSKMQFLNKLLQWLFCLQTPFRIFMALSWWTGFFGLARYRDMMKTVDLPRSILFQSEFCPLIYDRALILWLSSHFKPHVKEAPAASVPQMWMIIYGYPLCGLLMVIIYRTKMWIFSKTPVIKERLEIRTGRFLKFKCFH
ncbi:unnamed protein product [Oikopleura dioica]|uniref:Transmembrane protein n=1 Tax=Oikopleura dioica TaxID=34765 RepID=E4Y314_OIKDI|nr:unnamed protein product [Oikopleura dioica]